MFIKKQQRWWTEFNLVGIQEAPALVHYFGNRCDPFKTVLPRLIAGAGGDEERVFVVESPLSEIIDETIALLRHSDFPDQVVVDERQRALLRGGEAVARPGARQDRPDRVRHH